MTTTPFDPGEPFREEWARKMKPLSRAVEEATRNAMPKPIISDGMLEAIRQASAVQIPPGTLQFLQEQMRETRLAVGVTVRLAWAAHETATADLARIGEAIATAAAVRVAAEEEARPRTAAAEPTFTEADVQRIVTAAVRQVTGDRPEGWRWLFCTPVGLATFTTIVIAAASLVVACVQLANGSPTVKIENSPGATVYVQTEDGEAGQGQAVAPTTTESRDDAPADTGVDDRDLDE